MPRCCIMQGIWISKESVCSSMSEAQLTSSISGIEVFPFTQALSTSITAHIHPWLVTTESRLAYLCQDLETFPRKAFPHGIYFSTWKQLESNTQSLYTALMLNTVTITVLFCSSQSDPSSLNVYPVSVQN